MEEDAPVKKDEEGQGLPVVQVADEDGIDEREPRQDRASLSPHLLRRGELGLGAWVDVALCDFCEAGFEL